MFWVIPRVGSFAEDTPRAASFTDFAGRATPCMKSHSPLRQRIRIGVLGWHWAPALYYSEPSPPAGAVALELTSSTGPLKADGAAPLEPYADAAVEATGGLRVRVQDYFYDTGPMNKPYLVVDQAGNGTLHVGIKSHLGFMSA